MALVPAAQRFYARWVNGSGSRRYNQKALLSIVALLLVSWAISRAISG